MAFVNAVNAECYLCGQKIKSGDEVARQDKYAGGWAHYSCPPLVKATPTKASGK